MIDTVEEAVRYFVAKIANHKYKTGKTLYGSKGVIGLVIDVQKTAPLGMPYLERHYVSYNRRLLYGLTRICLEVPERDGDKAQTFQAGALRQAAQDNALISIVMEDGKIYQANAKDWLNYANLYHTIRIPRGEVLEEAHYPITKMTIINVDEHSLTNIN